jgi:hypothetical protein
MTSPAMERSVGYFSMEVALERGMPTYTAEAWESLRGIPFALLLICGCQW